MNNRVLVLLIALLFFACQAEKKSELLVIDVETGIENPGEILCSDFIGSFEYIPLETRDSCLIDGNPAVQILDNNLLVRTPNDCFLFDAKTGKFKTRIGKRGRGPGEYRQTIDLIDFDNSTVFFAGQNGDLLEYSLQNKFIKSIKIPTYNDGFENPSIPIAYTSYKNWIVCHFGNLTGTEKKFLMGINKSTGNADFIIPNKRIFEYNGLKISAKEVAFYRFNNEFYMKEDYNDTIYCMQDSLLIPHVVLSAGRFQLTHEMYWDKNVEETEFVTPGDVFETNNFLTFQYFYRKKPYFGLYSKKHQNVVVTEIENGLKNDIDNFVNFKPFMGITNHVLVGIADAYVVTEWFLKNSEKIDQLPPELQKLRNIKETDNPVVMIAKLKE